MSRTQTTSPTDQAMGRQLKALAHPDNGGSHELFIWTTNLLDLTARLRPRTPSCSGLCDAFSQAPTSGATDRVPYPPHSDFEELTRRALRRTQTGDVYGRLLALLADCRPVPREPVREQQGRGASYKMLAAIGHATGMTKAERVGWYRVAESIPLSDRHAGHILDVLKGRRA